MNQRISNPYLCGIRMKLREKRWSGMEFALSFVVVFVQAVISYLVFRTVFLHSARVDALQITLYYIIVNIAALSMQPAQFIAWQHMKDINDGSLILRIMRPDSYPLAEYCSAAALFLLRLAVNLLLILAAAAVLGTGLRPEHVLFGGCSMVLGFSILYLIQAIIGCTAVWFHDIIRLRDVIMTCLMLLGGQVIPSSLLFGSLKKLVYVTPVPYVYDIPVRWMMGSGTWGEIAVQLLWVLLLGAIYLWLYRSFVVHGMEYGG